MTEPNPDEPASDEQPSEEQITDEATSDEQPSVEQPAVEASPAKRRTNPLLLPLIAAGLVAVVAIAGAVTLGVMSATGAADLSEQLTTQTDRADHLSKQLKTYQDRETDLLLREGGLETREGDLDTRESELDLREESITATEEQIEATTLKDGYAYTVGSTMQAGTYQANATTGSCYWAITVSGTNYSDIVQNDFGTNGAITVTIGGDQDFQSQGCGEWTKVG